MRRIFTGDNVFDAALDRISECYAEGNRVVVSVSGGKDSAVCTELSLIVAQRFGKLPLDVVFREEEILYPGTHEYLIRLSQRPEIRMHWLLARQPMINVFNRANPFWWVCDPLVPKDQWVFQPPDFAEDIPEKHIEAIVSPHRFPVDPGKDLIDVVGLRVSESSKRMLGLVSSGGPLTGGSVRQGVLYRKLRPIYDWTDSDVWKSIHDNRWDYNKAYDVMHRMGIPARELRVGPVTMSTAAVKNLRFASTAWPKWFDRVTRRLEGIRQAAQFGDHVARPRRRLNETWEECYQRVCIDEAPAQWIRDRSIALKNHVLGVHARHSTGPIPDITPCHECGGGKIVAWKKLTEIMFGGDPFSLKILSLSASRFPAMEPEFFRPGAGTWNGTPTF
jgi:predicted phosphoadenosine phosphosulfate sulfurtransferase